MNRIDTRFAELKRTGRKGLIPFVTAGDPAADGTVAILHALVESGADLLELGVPFSDPMADGPVIQRASERALARGVGLRRVLAMVAEFRERDARTPVVLMGYLNPVEIFGWPRFTEAARAAGVDGILLVDCPPEEAESVRAQLAGSGLHQVVLAAPTTLGDRLAAVCAAAQGFLYYVSFAGVTGADRIAAEGIGTRLDEVRRASPVPMAVGFGIKTPEQALAIAAHADAVVIGSALVEVLAEAGPERAADAARSFLGPIRAALDLPPG